MPRVRLDPVLCTLPALHDGQAEVRVVLEQVLAHAAFRALTPSLTLELFVRSTSPRRMRYPRRGAILWQYLRSRFPDGNGGVDIRRVVHRVGAQYFRTCV